MAACILGLTYRWRRKCWPAFCAALVSVSIGEAVAQPKKPKTSRPFGSKAIFLPPPAPPMDATSQPHTQSPSPRTHFEINPKTPLDELLPLAPKRNFRIEPLLGNDLANVPEVGLHQPLTATELPEQRVKVVESLAELGAKIHHLNERQTDGFIEALLNHRPDLVGLPVVTGDACRLTPERTRWFQSARAGVLSHLPQSWGGTGGTLLGPFATKKWPPPTTAELFWQEYPRNMDSEDYQFAETGELAEHIAPARIAALMQVLGWSSSIRMGLVDYLTRVPHADSAKALARLAIFSPEEDVRQSALEGLKGRRSRDYDDVLRQGLRYPFVPVAGRTGEALVKLNRTDWVPSLIALLEEPDPRAPIVKQIAGKKAPVVRELVRINHMRNCLLCHPPGANDKDALTAPVPVPGPALTSLYHHEDEGPKIVVRFDITYLRQDFSMLQPDVHTGFELQRFDFVVRTRVVSEKEAEVFRTGFKADGPGALSPYQHIAQTALRELTGREAAPTAAAWRELLGVRSPHR